MTPAERAALRELCERATAGPWQIYSTPLSSHGGVGGIDSDEAVFEDKYLSPPDAAFIAASRTAIPALLDEVERLESRLEEQRKSLREDFEIAKNLRHEVERLEAEVARLKEYEFMYKSVSK